MTRQTYVWREGELWVKGTEPGYHRHKNRSHLSAPYVRTDGMDAIRSMADGKVYDSKSAYYDSVRRSGCEIVGDDRGFYEGAMTVKEPPPVPGLAQDIKAAIEELS